MQRPLDNDLLVLTTGERLSGTVLNESLKLQTAYGELKFQRNRVAGVDLGREPGGLAKLITVNNNYLSGFLVDSAISFKAAAGDERQIRREKVGRILFRLRQDELSGIARGSWIFLKTGDRMSGQVLLASLPLRTATETSSPKIADLRTLSNTNTPEPALLVMSNGENLRGTLTFEDLPVQLDTGQRLTLYQESVALIHSADLAKSGSESELARAASNAQPALPTGPTNIQGMVWIPAGNFVMGSPREEVERNADEGPQTKVIFPRGFWLGKYEVTQAEYQRVMGSNPSAWAGDPQRPVEKVSWFDAVEFCRKLTQMAEKDNTLPAGYIYRLPTEAEWEYACRAGSTTRFSDCDDPDGIQLVEYAWFTRNSESTTHPVGAKRPNRWGLYDMHGNVWEWCLDRWEDGLPAGAITNTPIVAKGSLRVARGGSWLYEPKACRSANRDDYSPWDKCSDIGFRVALAPLGL